MRVLTLLHDTDIDLRYFLCQLYSTQVHVNAVYRWKAFIIEHSNVDY